MIDLGWLGWLVPLTFGLAFGGSPSSPKSPPPPPSKTDAQVQAELAAQRAATRNRRGFSSTILTGDSGSLGGGGGGKATLGA